SGPNTPGNRANRPVYRVGSNEPSTVHSSFAAGALARISRSHGSTAWMSVVSCPTGLCCSSPAGRSAPNAAQSSRVSSVKTGWTHHRASASNRPSQNTGDHDGASDSPSASAAQQRRRCAESRRAASNLAGRSLMRDEPRRKQAAQITQYHDLMPHSVRPTGWIWLFAEQRLFLLAAGLVVLALRKLPGTYRVEIKDLRDKAELHAARDEARPEVPVSHHGEAAVELAEALLEVRAPGGERAGAQAERQAGQALARPGVERGIFRELLRNEHAAGIPVAPLHRCGDVFQESRVHRVVHVRIAKHRRAGGVPAQVPRRVECVTLVGGQEAAVGVRVAERLKQFALALGGRCFQKQELGLLEDA